MQTRFDITQLSNPEVSEAERILRKCVHCGFCLSTCPTYRLLGDERDSPRGRIYMIKEMLESGAAADHVTVRHIDRCLSCLSCESTCPSDVNYRHLVDHARTHIEKTYKRPWLEKLLRFSVNRLLPRPSLFRLLVLMGRPLALAGQFFPGSIGALFRLSLSKIHGPSWVDKKQTIMSEITPRRLRIGLHGGCVQKILSPQINESSARLLVRYGCEVVIIKKSVCCGALSLHQGDKNNAELLAQKNINSFIGEKRVRSLDAIVLNASGCGTMFKDYNDLFGQDVLLEESAKEISDMSKDITEVLEELGPLEATTEIPKLRVAYHSACSLQHGQGITLSPIRLLKQVGFIVSEPEDSHLCCGSAGTYNIFQPTLARKMLKQKVDNIQSMEPDVIATGNIGCMTQLSMGTKIPIVHTVELLDWATGGPIPAALAERV